MALLMIYPYLWDWPSYPILFHNYLILPFPLNYHMISGVWLNKKTAMPLVCLTVFLLLVNNYGACLSTKEDSIPDFQEGRNDGTKITSSGIELDFNSGFAGTWVKKNPINAPSQRFNFAMAYDFTDGIVLLFGGSTQDIFYLNDTWEYHMHNNTWIEIIPPISPQSRTGASLVYNSVANCFILFGGRGFNDTWIYFPTLKTWVQKKPSTSPQRRCYQGMIYDNINDLIILFGGLSGVAYDKFCNDTWIYNLNDNIWTYMNSTNSPSPRILFGMAYNSDYHAVIIFGGLN